MIESGLFEDFRFRGRLYVESDWRRSLDSARVMKLRVTVRHGEIGDEYQILVNPDLPMSRFLSMFTGNQADEMLVSAPPFNEIADSWLDFAETQFSSRTIPILISRY